MSYHRKDIEPPYRETTLMVHRALELAHTHQREFSQFTPRLGHAVVVIFVEQVHRIF